MLFRQVKHRQLQDVQLYGILRGVPSHHIAVSSLEMLTAKRVPSPLSFTYFILITCPLLHTSVNLYTDGLWSLFSKEAGILFVWICVLNALDRLLVSIGSASNEVSLRLPCLFSHI